jgi:hypothetical protein
MLNFKKVEITDQQELKKYLDKRPPYLIEHSFNTLFAWGDIHDFCWAAADDFAVVKTTYNGKTSFLPPFFLKEDEKNRKKALAAILDYAKAEGIAPVFSEVGKKELPWLQELLPDFAVAEDRNSANYIYSVQDLTRLSGKKYHNKRNHLNNFKRNYPEFCYLPITEKLLPLCRAAAERWNTANNISLYPTLLEEKQALEMLFDHWSELSLKGAVIAVFGQVEAFAIGEALGPDMAAILIEKANSEISGLYSAINQMFLEHEWQDFTYVNRAEDLGLANLRRTKLDYGPVELAMKYILSPAGAENR